MPPYVSQSPLPFHAGFDLRMLYKQVNPLRGSAEYLVSTMYEHALCVKYNWIWAITIVAWY
jgi:hypothetical protein